MVIGTLAVDGCTYVSYSEEETGRGSLDVSPPDVSPLSAFLCACCFFLNMGHVARANKVDWLMDWCTFFTFKSLHLYALLSFVETSTQTKQTCHLCLIQYCQRRYCHCWRTLAPLEERSEMHTAINKCCQCSSKPSAASEISSIIVSSDAGNTELNTGDMFALCLYLSRTVFCVLSCYLPEITRYSTLWKPNQALLILLEAERWQSIMAWSGLQNVLIAKLSYSWIRFYIWCEFIRNVVVLRTGQLS